MNHLTNTLASQIADEVIYSCCCEGVVKHLHHSIKEAIEEKEDYPHKELFEALFKVLEPYEKQFISILKTHWAKQERIVLANLKKMKKAWLQKGKVDNILYPKAPAVKALGKASQKIYKEILEKEGPRAMADIGKKKGVKQDEPPISFDIDDPRVKKWLTTYPFYFAEELEGFSIERLRAILVEGIEAGEGIPQLTKRVETLYEAWDKTRAERIARTEVIRARNKAALEAYRQSGVVKKKIWVTFFDNRTCPSCELLDGKVIGLEENYFDKGDPPEIIVEDGKKFTFDNSYTDIDAPPRHVSCRCSISAFIE